MFQIGVGHDNDDDEDDEDNNNGGGFSPALAPTLLFKFIIVLLVKFATDVVVYPSLFIYRLARLGKRKVVRAFEKMCGKGGDGRCFHLSQHVVVIMGPGYFFFTVSIMRREHTP